MNSLTQVGCLPISWSRPSLRVGVRCGLCSRRWCAQTSVGLNREPDEVWWVVCRTLWRELQRRGGCGGMVFLCSCALTALYVALENRRVYVLPPETFDTLEACAYAF